MDYFASMACDESLSEEKRMAALAAHEMLSSINTVADLERVKAIAAGRGKDLKKEVVPPVEKRLTTANEVAAWKGALGGNFNRGTHSIVLASMMERLVIKPLFIAGEDVLRFQLLKEENNGVKSGEWRNPVEGVRNRMLVIAEKVFLCVKNVLFKVEQFCMYAVALYKVLNVIGEEGSVYYEQANAAKYVFPALTLARRACGVQEDIAEVYDSIGNTLNWFKGLNCSASLKDKYEEIKTKSAGIDDMMKDAWRCANRCKKLVAEVTGFEVYSNSSGIASLKHILGRVGGFYGNDLSLFIDINSVISGSDVVDDNVSGGLEDFTRVAKNGGSDDLSMQAILDSEKSLYGYTSFRYKSKIVELSGGSGDNLKLPAVQTIGDIKYSGFFSFFGGIVSDNGLSEVFCNRYGSTNCIDGGGIYTALRLVIQPFDGGINTVRYDANRGFSEAAAIVLDRSDNFVVVGDVNPSSAVLGAREAIKAKDIAIARVRDPLIYGRNAEADSGDKCGIFYGDLKMDGNNALVQNTQMWAVSDDGSQIRSIGKMYGDVLRVASELHYYDSAKMTNIAKVNIDKLTVEQIRAFAKGFCEDGSKGALSTFASNVGKQNLVDLWSALQGDEKLINDGDVDGSLRFFLGDVDGHSALDGSDGNALSIVENYANGNAVSGYVRNCTLCKYRSEANKSMYKTTYLRDGVANQQGFDKLKRELVT